LLNDTRKLMLKGTFLLSFFVCVCVCVCSFLFFWLWVLIFVFCILSLFTLSFLMINPKHRIRSSPIESHELFEFFSDVPVRAELEGLKRQKVASGSFCEFCLECWNNCGMGLRFWFYIRSFLFSSKFLNIWLLDSELQQILVLF
jgi:hypothetical protein